MLFNSIQYLIFLPLVVAAYWAVPRQFRAILLLVASYYFYMSWMAVYGLLLAGLTVWNFLAGILIANPKFQQKRLAMVGAITGNLACLALYKYTNFIIESAVNSFNSVTHLMHVSANGAAQATAIQINAQNALLPIILPLGISFFVFEFIHYLADVYKGSSAIKNPVRFALFAAFFPSQIAGPIKRFQDFDEQVLQEKHFDSGQFSRGVVLIVEGMFKKVVLGDNLAQLVQPGFQAAASMGTLDAWICVLAFTLQIYYDFSGYTDIGRGSAMLLGYELPPNFNMPYIARSLSEFWHRWHMSLSTWLRDYLYIPMGGSKAGRAKQARNLVLTMLLGGLWHGASWHYVLWGAFHGVGLVLTHTWDRIISQVPQVAPMRKTAMWAFAARFTTLLLVILGWVVFRADNLEQAGAVYKSMFSLHATTASADGITNLFQHSTVPVALMLYAAYHAANKLAERLKKSHEPSRQLIWLNPPVAARAVALIGASLLIVGFAPHKAVPFIYFQF